MSRTSGGACSRLLRQRRRSAAPDRGKGPGRKAVRPALDNVDDALVLARREGERALGRAVDGGMGQRRPVRARSRVREGSSRAL